MGGPVGLDYGAVDLIFRLYEVADPAGVLESLQVMEAAALKLFSEQGNVKN
tara:strand:+ start:377 stop:529 length:153 start_codon:yes stop_codon:yes gene_type:complete